MDQIKKRDEVLDKYKWDLTRIFSDKKEAYLCLNEVLASAKELAKYQGKILESKDSFKYCVNLYFNINRKLEKLVVYSNLALHEDLSNSECQKLVGSVDKLNDNVSILLAFFIPEILNCDEKKVKEYIDSDDELKDYKFFFTDLFREKSHVLSLKEEKLLASCGDIFSSFSNIYDMFSDVDISFDKCHDENHKKIVLDESSYYRLIRSEDRAVRKEAFTNLYLGYEKYKNTFAEILKGSIKSDSFSAKIRNYKNALDMALSSLNIDDRLYDTLIKKTNDNLDLLHKYISLRKSVMKTDELHLYDLYSPLVDNIDKKYDYEEAKDLVLKSLNVLGDDYVSSLKNLFDSRCVDVYHTKNKKSSAYSWGCYDALPYVLLNYEGTFNDVSTIAHEMGHAMHSYYSNKYQSYQNASYSLFLAEIASQTNEILLNSYCYKNAKKKEEKLYFLNNLLDTIRTAFYRQVMFAEFEKIIHEKDESGDVLTTDSLCDIYYDLNKKYFGDDIVVDDLIKYEWIRISHFYRSFYVYMYATGIAVASSIANKILDGDSTMQENYLKLLKSGGKTYSLDILKEVGIDIVNDDTIDQVFVLFNKTIDLFLKTM